MSDSVKVAAVLGAVVLLVGFIPFLLIVCLNTISSQADMGWRIPHNLFTYLSALGLVALSQGARKSK
jgi:ABC-type enterochelin transport system permease subunit